MPRLSINEKESGKVSFIPTSESWMDPIIDYLKIKGCQTIIKKQEERRVKLRSERYMILEDVVYKKVILTALPMMPSTR